jgi:hypothetical protein
MRAAHGLGQGRGCVCEGHAMTCVGRGGVGRVWEPRHAMPCGHPAPRVGARGGGGNVMSCQAGIRPAPGAASRPLGGHQDTGRGAATRRHAHALALTSVVLPWCMCPTTATLRTRSALDMRVARNSGEAWGAIPSKAVVSNRRVFTGAMMGTCARTRRPPPTRLSPHALTPGRRAHSVPGGGAAFKPDVPAAAARHPWRRRSASGPPTPSPSPLRQPFPAAA